MLFRFLDDKGNKSVATYPDDSNFVVREKSDGKYDILVHLPQPVPPRVKPIEGLVRSLDKEVANRCVDEIYECLKSNKADCDLIGIQENV